MSEIMPRVPGIASGNVVVDHTGEEIGIQMVDGVHLFDDATLDAMDAAAAAGAAEAAAMKSGVLGSRAPAAESSDPEKAAVAAEALDAAAEAAAIDEAALSIVPKDAAGYEFPDPQDGDYRFEPEQMAQLRELAAAPGVRLTPDEFKWILRAGQSRFNDSSRQPMSDKELGLAGMRTERDLQDKFPREWESLARGALSVVESVTKVDPNLGRALKELTFSDAWACTLLGRVARRNARGKR